MQRQASTLASLTNRKLLLRLPISIELVGAMVHPYTQDMEPEALLGGITVAANGDAVSLLIFICQLRGE